MSLKSNQALFNLITGVAGFLGAWILAIIWQEINETKVRNDILYQNLSEVKVLVAGDYVRKSELKDYMIELSSKLQRIEDKLDTKADKK
jgi:hypothetical protein